MMGTPSITSPRNSLLVSYLNPAAAGAAGASGPSTASLLTALNRAYKNGEAAIWLHNSCLVRFTRPDSDDGVTDEQGPGVRELANRVWEHARRRAEVQVVVVSGVPGSGKSKAVENIVSHITTLASAVPSSQSTTSQSTAILNASMTILTSLTSAATPTNPFTSFYAGLDVTLSLDIYGAIASAKISTPYVDASRLTHLPTQSGHRTFGVFYQLLRGATPQEQSYLSLLKPDQYEYLKKSGTLDLPSNLNLTVDDAAAADDFREALRICGIKGRHLRGIYQTLAACLLLGNLKLSPLEGVTNIDVLEDACTLLDLDPDKLVQHITSAEIRDSFVQDIYRLLVEWVISFINTQLSTTKYAEPGSQVTVIEIPNPSGGQRGYGAFARAWTAESFELQLHYESFNDTKGLNAEMIADGIILPKVSSESNSSCVDLMDKIGSASETLTLADSLTVSLESQVFTPNYRCDSTNEFSVRHNFALGEWVPYDAEAGFVAGNTVQGIESYGSDGSFLKDIFGVLSHLERPVLKSRISELCKVMENARVWTTFTLKPTASQVFDPSSWDVSLVSSQVRTFHLAQHHARRKTADYSTDFSIAEFYERYSSIFPRMPEINIPLRDKILRFLDGRKLPVGEWHVGNERVWVGELGWENLEGELDDCIAGARSSEELLGAEGVYTPGTPQTLLNEAASGFGFYGGGSATAGSREGLLDAIQDRVPKDISPDKYYYGMGGKEQINYANDIEARNVEVVKTTATRKAWLFVVWLLTWPIPSFMLRYVGRMKRKDVQMAWREKVTICFFIFLLCGSIIFYIIFFQKLICPEFDKVWDSVEVSEHQGTNDFYVSVRGRVYDISTFWRLQHSDTGVQTSSSNMQQFAGQDLTEYFPYPLTQGCPGLVTDDRIALDLNNSLIQDPTAIHFTGPAMQGDTSTALYNISWYQYTFLPKIKQYYKGDLVVEKNDLKTQGEQGKPWAVINGNVYNLQDYFDTLATFDNDPTYTFLDQQVSGLFQGNPGQDVTAAWNALNINSTTRSLSLQCLNNVFFVGTTDPRQSPRCQVNNYLLLTFTIIICATILVKFLAALQLGSKRSPARQDKYVICQVPAYTEGEDQLRKALDSLTFLNYDDKKKLLFVICDGTITGSGNQGVPTYKIVLDILGSDPKLEPPVHAFKSVAEGMDQLNYAKVYSGLYEFEGHVVPYVVVHKCGRPNETVKPGNRGKRDSQILLFNFLNRCYYNTPMTPLELEIYHQIANVIGINPRMYEYLLTVDADTEVTEDSLNRLVACCANDGKVVGVCGETSLQNEERSWWTMIQVYEYYISHALAKSFESLFGTVTCLPGCFSLYRIKTFESGRNKSKPYIIHPGLIKEYADNKVDTLHKKNLLHLGEDRYLTTLLTKHFPYMKTTFTPDALARTAAPETWKILISQRRRWINSTVHNLLELVLLNDMCGFCCFSMRFVVFIDLFGTLILPATVIYLGYLIYLVASGSGQFPLIAIIMLASIYGLQAIIFILKRRWQHIGWMIVYLLAYPIYGFALPVYSFWHMDDFAWGNTRVVVGEKGGKKVVASSDDEQFDDSMIPMQQWESYAHEKGLPLGPSMEVVDPAATVYAEEYPVPASISRWQQGVRGSYLAPPSQVGVVPRYAGSQYAPSMVSVPRMAPTGEFLEMSEFANGPRRSMVPSQVGIPMPMPRGSFAMDPRHSVYAGSEAGFSAAVPRVQTVGTEFEGFDSVARLPDDSLAREVVRNVLKEVDLETTKTNQVRALVETKLGLGVNGPVSPHQKKALEEMIDEELEKMI